MTTNQVDMLALAARRALVLLISGLFAVAVARRFTITRTTCTQDPIECPPGQLGREGARALATLGLSLDAYAAFSVALGVSFGFGMLVVGGMILWRRGVDRGGIAIALLLIYLGAYFSTLYSVLSELGGPLGMLARYVRALGLWPFTFLLFIFPDGRFVPRWSRWLVIVVLVNTAIPASPIALDKWHLPLVVLQLTGVVALFVAVGAQIFRYRRVSGPVQRIQTKWVVFGSAVALVGFMSISFISIRLFPNQQNMATVTTRAEIVSTLVSLPIVYGFMCLIPLSFGIAILRHRLYDIDVIINRALVYGALTATLAAVYFGGVALLQGGLQLLTGQQSSQLAVVASTLAIAALFQPLRRRIQGAIDHRFYRRKYDATRTLAAFSAQLRGATDLDRLSADLVATVEETMQPAHVSLWLRPARRGGSFQGDGK
jgi:hypothetical protein